LSELDYTFTRYHETPHRLHQSQIYRMLNKQQK